MTDVKHQLMLTRGQLADALEDMDKVLGLMGEKKRNPKLPKPLNPKLAFIIGHEEKRPGAFAKDPIGLSEYEFWKEAAEAFWVESACDVHFIYRDEIGIMGAYAKAEELDPHAVIELHFNSYGDSRVFGTETLFSDIHDDEKVFEEELAKLIQKNTVEFMDSYGRGKAPMKADRGIKRRPRTSREAGSYNLMQLTHLPTLLVEPFFASNERDRKIGKEKHLEFLGIYVQTFLQWFNRAGLGAS